MAKHRSLKAISFLAPNLFPVYQFMMVTLSHHLGYPIDLSQGEHYDEVLTCDLAFICGLPYVLYAAPRRTPAYLEPLVAPILRGERFQNRPIYFSDVVVQRDSPFETFADLRGCSWAYNEPLSQSGYGITRYHLLQMGMTNGYFGTVIETSFHHLSLQKVATGEIAASAIDVQVLMRELMLQPALAEQVRVIATLGPSTIQPLATACHLPDELKHDIRAILLNLHQTPQAQSYFDMGFIDRWVSVTDADYADIRMMLTACERANFLSLK